MTHRLITSARKADRILQNVHFTGNFNIFAQVQPKRLELKLFLSQLSSHPPIGFGKSFNQNKGKNVGACMAGGFATDQKSSPLSGCTESREGDEEKSKKIENKLTLAAPGTVLKSIDETAQKASNVPLQEITDDENEKESVPAYLAELVNAAKSTDPQIQYSAVNLLRKFSTSGRNPPIDFLIGCNILPTLVDCLSSQNRALQVDALWALTTIVAGTSEQAQAVVEAGAVPHFLRLLTSPHQSVREFALDALARLIAKGPQLRDCVPNVEVLASLLNCIRPDTTRNFLHKVLLITAWTFKLLTDRGNKQIQMVIDRGVLPKLVHLLSHDDVQVLEQALRAVGNIVNGTNGQVQAVLNCDALSHFHNLLNHPKKIICEIALWVLSKVAASNFSRVQAVIDAGLVPLIIHHLEKGDLQTQKAAVNALSFMTFKGTKEQVQHLVDRGVIPLFADLLSCKDSVVVWDVLVGIECILAKLPLNQGSGDKACTLIEECGGLDKIKTLQNHENMRISKIAHDIFLKFSSENY